LVYFSIFIFASDHNEAKFDFCTQFRGGGLGTYSVPLKQLLKPVSVSNADIPLRERLDFWRAVFGSEFELVDDGRNRTAPARAQGYVFGTAALVQLSGPGYRSIRNRRHISRLSSERINIVRRRAKGMVAVMKDGREFICRPGEIFFQRDTNPFLQAFEDGGLQEAEILGLSWADVRSHMQMRDTNHIQSNRLAGYGGALIGAWMDSLIHAVKTLPELDVRQLAEPSTQLVAAVLDGNLNDQGYRAAAINAARLALAKAYIEWQINNPHLNPNLIAGYCRCSVRTLTKIFEPLGGVMNFVRDRRLMRIYAHLTHPGTQRRKLGELARDYGFATHAHFSDAFRRKFDMSPREVLMESLFHTFEKIVPSLDVFDFEAIRATVIRPSNKNTLTEGA
jgi:AraC-like DNA-binding protein